MKLNKKIDVYKYGKLYIRDKNDDNKVKILKQKGATKQQNSEEFWENFTEWISYYRDNPHRFATEYLGLNLHDWQQMVLYQMWTKESTLFLGSRGVGKTFLVMVYCVCKCLLYPNTTIRVASANKKQAGFLLAKMKELKTMSPLIESEIISISIGKDESKILLKGGGEIATVVASDGARGERCHIVIVDEREIVDKDIIDKVFLPFLTAQRTPPYLKNPKYAEYANLEKNHFIEMSSIGSSSSSMYKEFLQYIEFIAQGNKNYAVFSIPYQVPMRSGVIKRSIIEKMVREATTSVEAFRQEMEVLPTGEGESSMFTFEEMNKNRRINVPLCPITDDEYIEYDGDIKKSKYYVKKERDKNGNYSELRILCVDLAVMGTKLDDNSIFKVLRAKPNGEEYITDVPYIESMCGVNTDIQILRIKQLFYDLECDYCVLDGGGIGQPFFDIITKKTVDYVRNKTYPAWKTIKPDEKQEIRVLDKNAEPVVHLVKIGGASAPSVYANMVIKTKRKLQNRKINLLANEQEVIDYLNKKYKYQALLSSNKDSDNQIARRLIAPFSQTSALIKEGINTQVTQVANGIKIDEKSGRKDRIITLLYGMSFIFELEQDLEKPQETIDLTKYIMGSNRNNIRTNRFGTSFSGFGR